MTPKRLSKIRSQLEALLKNPHGRKPMELESIARQLGRTKRNRGKEPTWVREDDPILTPPLSIPNHGGKDMKSRTVESVVEQLLDDCDTWNQALLMRYEDE